MADKAWKQFERRLAKDRVNGKRVGVLGGEDVTSRCFSEEAKLLKKIPRFIEKVMAQAEENCPPRKIPVVIIKPKGKGIPDKDAYVLTRYGNWSIIAKYYEESH